MLGNKSKNHFSPRGMDRIGHTVTKRVHVKLNKSGVKTLVGGQNIFAKLEDAVRSAAPRVQQV